jgi:hypothetical protein
MDATPSLVVGFRSFFVVEDTLVVSEELPAWIPRYDRLLLQSGVAIGYGRNWLDTIFLIGF